MRFPNPEETRVETLTAALIYLMSHYARTGCPRLAACIAGHLQCLSRHSDAAPVLRDVCASMYGAWMQPFGRHDGPVH